MTRKNNYAFIDGQNVHMGTSALGWSVDFFRFRKYLSDKYSIARAYWFIGYIPENQKLYEALQAAGFIVVFKEVSRTGDGKPKGNVDVDLTLHTVDLMDDYEKALLITSDGDFASLVRHLKGKGQFKAVLSPNRKHTSFLLRKATASDGSIQYLDDVRRKIGRK